MMACAVAKPAAMLAISAAMTACTVVVEEDRPLPPREWPQVCTQQYQPVCAARDDRRRTFANACEARAADHTILRRGEC